MTCNYIIYLRYLRVWMIRLFGKIWKNQNFEIWKFSFFFKRTLYMVWLYGIDYWCKCFGMKSLWFTDIFLKIYKYQKYSKLLKLFVRFFNLCVSTYSILKFNVSEGKKLYKKASQLNTQKLFFILTKIWRLTI